MTAAGNGSGIKAGGFGLDASSFPDVVPRHVVRFNVTFGNRSSGFYANHHPGGIDWIGNTAFDNPRNFDLLADVGAADHRLRNNLAVAPGQAVARQTAGEIDDAFNSWSLPVEVGSADFVSMTEAEALSARDAAGKLQSSGFLRLRDESDLIDQGEDVGFAFNGAAPDLGAFESGPPLDAGAGSAGEGGAGGGAGSAGGATAGAGGGAGTAGRAGADAGGGGASATDAGRGSAAGAGGATARPSGSPPIAGAAADDMTGAGSSGSGCTIDRRGQHASAWSLMLLLWLAIWIGRTRRVRARR
jgi:hypothetical protein